MANPKNITNNTGAFLGVWGRIEVFNESYWNPLCSLDFTLNNAKVICRSLDLPVNDTRFSNAELMTD